MKYSTQLTSSDRGVVTDRSEFRHLPVEAFRMLQGSLAIGLAIAAAVLGFGIEDAAHAGTVTKAATGTELTSGTNWTGSATPTQADTAAFVGTSLGSGLTFGAPTTWGAISDTGALATIELSGSVLTLKGNQTLNSVSNAGLYIASNGKDLLASNDVVLAASQNWEVGGARTATFAGLISGSFGLTKTGTGTLVLSAANTYSGGMNLSKGAIQLGDNASLGTGPLTFSNTTGGESTRVQSTDATARTIGNAFAAFAGATGTYAFGNTTGGTGDLVFSNTTTSAISGTRTFQIDNPRTEFDMGFSSGLKVSKTGSGTIILAGESSYTGGTIVSAGAVRANNAKSSLGSGYTNVAGTGVLAGGSAASTGVTGGPVILGSGGVPRSGTITAGTGATASDTVGSLASDDEIWNRDGSFFFKFASSDGATATNGGTGSAGTNWDLLKMGTLTLNQNFMITLSKALNGSFTGGKPGEYLFATTTGISIATATSIPTGAAKANQRLTSLFTFNDTSAALGIAASHFQIDVGSDGTSLYLNYDGGGVSPVPEPTVVLMSGLGGAALLVRRSRRTGFSALRWLAALRAA